MKQEHIELANAIAKGVGDALARTPIKVKLQEDVKKDQTIFEHMKALKDHCDTFDSCSKCDIQIICGSSMICDWQI